MLKLSEKQRIVKNLVVLNTTMFLTFASLNALVSVQSVLNDENNLGLASVCVSYGVQLLTCLVIPQVVMQTIGFKWTLGLSQIFYTSVMVSNVYPKFYTLIPTAVLNGIAQSLTWNLIGIYLTILSEQYAKCCKEKFLTVQSLFFGIFTTLLLASNSFGSLLVGTILQTDDKTWLNSTFDYEQNCGVNYCPNHILPESSNKPSIASVYILCGILIFLCLIGTLITFLFLDNLQYEIKINCEEIQRRPSRNFILVEVSEIRSKRRLYLYEIGKLVNGTPMGGSFCLQYYWDCFLHYKGQRFKNEFHNIFILLKQSDTYLLLPMSVYTGFELTYIWNELNKSFITCLINVNYVGWCNILFGLSGGLFSILFGYIARYTTLIPQLVFIFTLVMGHCVFLLSWTPNPVTGKYVVFLMTFVFSITESISTIQIRGLYGVQFPNNPSAFSIATISQTIGFITGLITSMLLCTNVKTYIYFGLALCSLMTYTVLFSKTNYLALQYTEPNCELNLVDTTPTTATTKWTMKTAMKVSRKEPNGNDRKQSLKKVQIRPSSMTEPSM